MELLKKYRHTVICAILLLILSVFGCVTVVFRYHFTGWPRYGFLAWNLFLAWVPFGISIIMSYIYTFRPQKTARFLLMPLGFIWLLFYPNAPYMITDFVHFRDTRGLLMWYDLVIYSIFSFTSFLLGFVSIYLISEIIEKWINKTIAWLLIGFVLFLSSFGIYLGRFIRLNSWDIFVNPVSLLATVLQNINRHSIAFSLIYGTMLTLIYAFLYGLTYLKKENADKNAENNYGQ